MISMIPVLCSAADAVCSGNCFTVFEFLTLNVAFLSMLLHLSNFVFDVGWGSLAEFSNAET